MSIESVDLSPDKSRLLIKVFPEYGLGALYTANLTGGDITHIAYSAQEEIWSPSGKYIAYTKPAADTGPAAAFIYDTTTNQNISFNATHPPFCTTSYSDLIWAVDEKYISAHYRGYDCNNSSFGSVLSEGETKLILK